MRVDVQAIMEQLRDKIGQERGKLYWDALRQFLLAKLSKREFDHIVITQLGTEHIGLHNCLIQAVLVNAKSGQAPPEKQLTVFTRMEVKKRNNRVHIKPKKSTPQKVRKYHMLDQGAIQPANNKHSLAVSGLEDKRDRKKRKQPVLGKQDTLRPDRRGSTRSPAETSRMAGTHSTASNSALWPRHKYSGMIDLEPTEVAYEVRQHVASIGMNVTQDSVDYLRFAMQATVNRVIDACKVAQLEHPEARNGVVTISDLQRALADLQECPRGGLPSWLLTKLFENTNFYSGRARMFEAPMVGDGEEEEEEIDEVPDSIRSSDDL